MKNIYFEKFMKIITKYKLLWILPIIGIVPIVINWLLSRSTPFNFLTIGESKDWLSFYGSYIGGIITASISFFILNSTIKFNRNESEILRGRQELVHLEDQLAEHITFLNFHKIGTIALVLNDDALSKNEILKLEAYSYELIRKSNALHLIYEDRTELHIIDYVSKFDACYNQISSDIDAMTKLISDLPARNLSDESQINLRITILSQINKEIKKHLFHIDNFAVPVYNAAKEWIKQERENLNLLTTH